jgi:hypothetical protein
MLWQSALSGAGNALGQGIAQYGAQKQEQQQEQQHQEGLKARDAATVQLIQAWDGKDPKMLHAGLVKIGGADWAMKQLPAIQAFKAPPSKDSKVEIPAMRVTLKNFLKQPPEMQAITYPHLVQRHGDGLSELGVAVDQLPKDFTPDFVPQVQTLVDSLDEVAGAKKDEPKPARLTNVEIADPNDPTKPLLKGFTDEEIAQGVPKFVAPPKPEKAEKTLAEKAAEARTLAAAHAQGVADVRANEPGEEFALNPEGVVLSGYGKKQTDAVRKQAAERGLPVFENTTTQVKGMQLAGIVAEAKELAALLEDADVAAVVGPALSNPVKALRRASGGLVDLPPNAQRALQLAGMLSDSELRKRSGASAGDAEMKRILGFAVSPTMPLGNLKTNLDGMLKAGARDYKALSGIDIGLPDEAPAGGAPVQIKDAAEYARIPPGALYITPDGRTKRKGNR